MRFRYEYGRDPEGKNTIRHMRCAKGWYLALNMSFAARNGLKPNL